jgi:hypothetical protein
MRRMLKKTVYKVHHRSEHNRPDTLPENWNWFAHHAERPGSGRPGQRHSIANSDAIPALPEAG